MPVSSCLMLPLYVWFLFIISLSVMRPSLTNLLSIIQFTPHSSPYLTLSSSRPVVMTLKLPWLVALVNIITAANIYWALTISVPELFQELYMNSVSDNNSIRQMLLLFWFYRWENQSTERVNNTLGSGRTKIWTQIFWLFTTTLCCFLCNGVKHAM